VGAIFLLAACSSSEAPAASPSAAAPSNSSWSDVQAAGKREGRIVISGQGAPDAETAFSAGFNKQFPDIQLEYQAMTSPEATAKLMTERKGNLFGVDLFVHGTPDILTTLIPAGAIDPMQPYLIGPDIQDQSAWLGGKFNFADDAGKYDLIFTGGVKVPLVYNPNLVQASAFTSYKDLLDPRWKGKMAMLDPRVAGSGQGMATFWYQTPGLGKDYLKQLLTDQAVVFTKDDRQLTDWVGRGEYPIAVGSSDFTAFALKAKGVPVESLPAEALKETSYLTAGFGSAAVMNRAPHPNATKLYLDWMLSKSGQEDLVKVTSYPSRRLDASAAGLPEPVVPKQGVHYQDSASETTAKVKTEVVDYLKSILPN